VPASTNAAWRSCLMARPYSRAPAAALVARGLRGAGGEGPWMRRCVCFVAGMPAVRVTRFHIASQANWGNERFAPPFGRGVGLRPLDGVAVAACAAVASREVLLQQAMDEDVPASAAAIEQLERHDVVEPSPVAQRGEPRPPEQDSQQPT
jgi:hypothetical protein